MNKNITILAIIGIIIISIFSGCIDYHGFSIGQKVKTSKEYNEQYNTSYSGEIVLIENINDYYDSNKHYLITIYNKTTGSKTKIDEGNLIPDS